MTPSPHFDPIPSPVSPPRAEIDPTGRQTGDGAKSQLTLWVRRLPSEVNAVMG